MGFIYMLTSPSGKRYIGQTRRTVRQRVQQHLRDSTKSNSILLCRAIAKYGGATFKVETLLEVANHLLDEYEMKMIAAYNTTDKQFGYNISPGGAGHNFENPESMAKMMATIEAKKDVFTAASNKRWSADGSKERQSAALKSAWSKPEAKARKSAASALWQNDPSRTASKEKHRANSTAAQKRPDVIRKRSEAYKKLWVKPDYRKWRSDINAEATRRPETNAKRSESLKIAWAKRKAAAAATGTSVWAKKNTPDSH